MGCGQGTGEPGVPLPCPCKGDGTCIPSRQLIIVTGRLEQYCPMPPLQYDTIRNISIHRDAGPFNITELCLLCFNYAI